MEFIAGIPITCAMAPVFAAANTGKLCEDYTRKSCAHMAWTYPLHAVVTVLAVAAQPILSLIAIVAAAIFKLLSFACCSHHLEETAKVVFNAGICGLRARAQLIARLLDPSFELHSSLNVSLLQLGEGMGYFYNYNVSTWGSLFAAGPAKIAAQTGALCIEKANVDAQERQAIEAESRRQVFDFDDDNIQKKHFLAPYAHAVWAYPLNALVTVLAVAVQPALAVIGIIAAAVFKLFSCCSDDAGETSKHIFHGVIAGCSARPELLVRIFDPSYTIADNLEIKDLEV